MTGPLNHIRVIDFATPRGEMAGRILADLGAEVIKVEPPQGVDSRRLPPFGPRGPSRGPESPSGDPETNAEPGDSLFWAALGLGKRSVVLDIDNGAQRAQLRRLLLEADVFIESGDPGQLESYGLDYSMIGVLNPSLIYVSITPYGQTGPQAGDPATDLTLEAAGGLLSMQGDHDRPPLPVGYPQAGFHAGAQAAADVVVALYERQRSGLGQQLDVSMQAAIVWTLMNATGYPPNHDDDPPQGGSHRGDPPAELFPGLLIPPVLDCADGQITYGIALPLVGGRTHAAALDWVQQTSPLPAHLQGIDWANWISLVVQKELTPQAVAESIDVVAAFIKTKTLAEIQAFAVPNRMLMGAIYNAEHLLNDPQLAARDYWTPIDGRLHPGPFAKLSATPISLDRPAPSLAQDQDLVEAPRPPRAMPSDLLQASGDRRGAFDGLKVADFAWVGVGPIISKALADHGATVVHVESLTRPDILRLVPPYKRGEAGLDNAQFMANFNSSKLGLATNLATEEGRRLARRLVDWADVVVESFTPGTMAKFGLDYASLSKDRPDLVMLSTCLRGQTGPEAGYTGFGNQGASLAGLMYITGWPDRAPCGPWGAYTDFINPRFGVAALSAALIHRARTGEGQYIDHSQVEAAIHFMEPLLLDYTVNGRIAPAAGHDSLYAAPHGVYPAAGDERWIAIAVETADQWRALRSLAPLDAFADSALDALDARFGQHAAIDEVLRVWTADQDGFELAGQLRACGVPASVVLWPSDLYDDRQLKHREFFVELEHSVMGSTPYDGLVTRFSETPGRLRKAAPALGEDTDHVLRDILALPDDEIAQLAAAAAIS